MPRPPSLGGRPRRSRSMSLGGDLPVREGMEFERCNSQVGANGFRCWGWSYIGMWTCPVTLKSTGHSLCVTFNLACAWTTHHGLWTVVEYLFCFKPKIAFRIQRVLVTNVLYNWNAGPDGAIFWILLAVVILQRRKLVRCVQFTGQRAISPIPNDICSKTLRLVLEYVENCQSRISFVAFGCLDGQILV